MDEVRWGAPWDAVRSARVEDIPQFRERVEVVTRRCAKADELQLLQRMQVHRRCCVRSLARLIDAGRTRSCSADFFISCLSGLSNN